MKTLLFWVYCFAIVSGSIVLPACNAKTAKGRQVFQQCGACHNADSKARKMGPGLKDLFKQERLTSNGKKVTEANIRAKIDEGGNGMPAYQDTLSNQDKDDVIAYLKTL